MSLSRSALIRVLTTVQNSATFANQDIMTFCGFLNTAEVAEHLQHNFSRLPAADKARALAALKAEHAAIGEAA